MGTSEFVLATAHQKDRRSPAPAGYCGRICLPIANHSSITVSAPVWDVASVSARIAAWASALA